jgi:hypothetical protein
VSRATSRKHSRGIATRAPFLSMTCDDERRNRALNSLDELEQRRQIPVDRIAEAIG